MSAAQHAGWVTGLPCIQGHSYIGRNIISPTIWSFGVIILSIRKRHGLGFHCKMHFCAITVAWRTTNKTDHLPGFTILPDPTHLFPSYSTLLLEQLNSVITNLHTAEGP